MTNNGIRGLTQNITFIDDIGWIQIPEFPVYVNYKVEESEDNLKQTNITRAGALIDQTRWRVSEIAQATLDLYANSRVKKLKLATKAYKYYFPFYLTNHQRKSYEKICELLIKNINSRIPYINAAKVPFLSIEGRVGARSLLIRMGPYTGAAEAKSIFRYVRYLAHLVIKNRIPLGLDAYLLQHIVIPEGQTVYTMTQEQRAAATYPIVELRVDLRLANVAEGYYLLHHIEELMKAVETLHRKAHYAESTVGQPVRT